MKQQPDIIKEKLVMNRKRMLRKFSENVKGVEATDYYDADFVEKIVIEAYTIGGKAERDKLPKIIEDYSNFLHKNHYIDSDYYTEEPNPIEEFLSLINK